MFGTVVLYLLLGGLVASEVLYSAHDCNFVPDVDGCSFPGGIPYYTELFRRACNQHDICYSCGSFWGVSRKSCDISLWERIEDQCWKTKRGYRLSLCRDAAVDYYNGVRLAGGLFYKSSSPSWCKDNWVRNCF